MALLLVTLTAPAMALEPITLPPPDTNGGKPLMQCLAERQSLRAYDSKPLPDQVLSNLLWAAWGINRPESGKHTAPSASNRQEIDVYVTTAQGVYLYDPVGHSLQPVMEGDLRAATGTQPYVAEAPINLVYVADTTKMRVQEDPYLSFYAGADTGFIAQNVYLFCASEGLACCVRGLVDRDALAEKMGLRPTQRVVFGHSVGYPKPGAAEH
jgi:SagB-type dehydrogenase family enzyme